MAQTGDNPTRDESLYDEYFEAVMSGSIESPSGFLHRHGEIGDDLRARLESVHAMATASRRRESSAASATRGAVDEPVEPLAAYAPAPGRRLGGYRLDRVLGQGGMGVVYLATEEALDRQVAIKVLHAALAPSSTAVERFDREARAIARLRHPNLVSVYAVGHEHGVRYLAMEYIEGSSLAEVLSRSREHGEKLEVTRVLRWGEQIARALTAAHAEGIVHRDVKPSNIRIAPDGQARLVDFGLAKDLRTSGATLTEAFIGSPQYVAPEQIGRGGGEVDGRADVYGLGVVLYECLTGRTPFAGATLEQLLRRILEDEPPPLRLRRPEASRDVATVVHRALEKEPPRRYPAAGAFAEDLRALLELRPISARRPGPWETSRRWARRHRGASAALLTGAFVLALGGTLRVVHRWREVDRLIADAQALVNSDHQALEASSVLEREYELLREGRIGQSRLAELLGLTRWEVLERLERYGIDQGPRTTEELASDAAVAERAASS